MKAVDIIGVPLDFGANKRGVDMGPAAIRYSGLYEAVSNMGRECRDLGNIDVPITRGPTPGSANANDISRLNQTYQELAQTVGRSLREGRMPLILGGDHSIAIGSLTGVHSVIGDIGILWLDAHGDFNTLETSLSGNLHGMPLALCSGAGKYPGLSFTRCIHPKNVVIIGLRSIDPGEAALMERLGVTVFTIEDIDSLGMREVMHRSLAIAGNGTAGIHLSFDLDVLDPAEAPGVGTPVQGGLTYREAHFAAEMVAACPQLCSIEFVELNPILDSRNQTGELAVSLICSVLGKRIFKRIPLVF